MSSKLDTAAGKLETLRAALLERYDDEDLHQLRVNLRRMRSALKGRPGREARLLRHGLGELADATNAARDWDTLVCRARRELGPRQYRLLEPRLLARREAAHVPVTNMLRSERWDTVLQDWQRYAGRHPPRTRGRKKRRAERKRREEAVACAWARARAVDSVRNWHRLRIAIKQLRYHFDEVGKKSRGRKATATLRQCRRLQDHLGDWHDVVVHRQLLHELALDCAPDREQRTLALLRRWADGVEKQGRQHLAAARAEFETRGDDKPLGVNPREAH